ncbi:MAG: HEAT repeat domain-containing protein [Proteobacteria bacterium]|nr:HEAT repeat domain-containing protein [Pseudomonadota bacterium]
MIERNINLQDEEEVRRELKRISENFIINKENLDFLLDCLSHQSWRVRKDAVTTAVLNQDIEIIKLLISGLSSEDNAGLRNACQEALTKIGKKAVKYLIDVFDESDKDVRKFIIDIIGDIGEKEYCKFLIKALTDEDENVVISAVENLGKLRCKESVGSLLSLLDASNQWLSFVILESISQIGYLPDAISLLPLWKVSPLRKPILDLLPIINPEYTVEIFKKAFHDKSPYIIENSARNLYKQFLRNKEQLPFIKNSLIKAINYDKAFETLLEKNGDDAKAYALCAYINEGEHFFIPMLENASNETLEFFANLSNYAPFHNENLILNLLDNYKNSKQAYLVYLCGVFKIKKSLKQIKKFYKADYGHTRQSLAYSLGKIGEKESIDCLFNLLLDPYPDVREQAIKSLSHLLDPENFPFELVTSILNSENKEHIIALLDLLSNLKYNKKEIFDKTLKSHFPEVRAKTLEIIGKLKLYEFLQETLFYLTDEDERVQQKAIEALGEIGNDESIDILYNFFDKEDFDIKKSALISLCKLSPHSVKHIEDKIFTDIHPILYFTVLELMAEGVPFSTTTIIDTAFNFDDDDIFRELALSLKKANKINELQIFIKTLQAKKGEEYLSKILPENILEA